MNHQLLIAGGTGFIGQALVNDRLAKGDCVTVLGRDKSKIQQVFANDVEAISWDELATQSLTSFDTVINLAGENIGERRWTLSRRHVILNSRIQATTRLAALCADLGAAAPRLLNASAIGIYDLQPMAAPSLTVGLNEKDAVLKNSEANFLHTVATQWELATEQAKTAGVSVVNLRFAVVLSPHGGMLKKLLPLFKSGLGQKVGDGKQILSWISLTDVINVIDFLLQHREVQDAINVVSPQAVTQQQFANDFAHALHRPRWLWLPGIIVKLAFGQMGEELLLRGQYVQPGRLQTLGYHFIHPTLKDFFQDLSL